MKSTAANIICPRSAVGGLTPNPMKLNPASARTTAPRSMDVYTRSGDTEFGSICLKTIFIFGTPIAFATST